MAAEPLGMAVAEDLDRYEATLRAQGFRRIAGVDEVGRGALAGPLVAAAVVLPEGFTAVPVLTKPYIPRTLVEALSEVLMRSRGE